MEALGHTFLDPDNTSRFTEVPGRCVPRSVQYSAGASAPMPLVSHILDRVRALAGGALQWFECVCVTVIKDDGMTWSAESVRVALLEKHPGFRCWTLAGRDQDGMPQIAELVGEEAFLKLAARFKLTSPFFTLTSWIGPLVVLLAVAIAVATKFGDELAKAQTGPFGARWRDLLYVGLLAGSALLTLVSKYFVERVLGRTRQKSREEFLKEKDGNEKKLEYLDFVEAVAGLLVGLDYPRFVIVDGFERLDYTTRKVVERYCKDLCKEGKGGELWIVFEGEDGEKLSVAQSGLPLGYGGSRTRSYRQILLTPEEKVKLVAVAGLPERAVEFAVVKLICGEAREGEKRFLDLFAEWRRRNPANPERYGLLDFLNLCALTSTPGIFYLQHRELRHDLAVKSGVRSAALTGFLPGTSLGQPEIGDQLVALDTQFRSALVYKKENDPTSFRVVAAAAKVLAEDAGDLGLLRPAGLGHVFWSLYWYAKVRRQPLEAFWVRKLGEHLLKAESYRMPEEHQAETVRILFEVYLYTLDGSSRMNLFGQMLPLLERVAALLQSGPVIDAARRKALTDFAWQSYLLVGGRVAREVLLELGSSRGAAGAESAPDLLERYFLDAITDDESQQRVLQAAVDESGDAIRDFGRVRSAWLNLTMLRFLGSSKVQQGLMDSVTAGPVLFDRARERLGAAAQASAPSRALDYMTLSLASWAFGPSMACAGFPVRKNRFVQQLEMTRATIDLAAEELRPKGPARPTAGPAPDYLGDALRREACFFALAGLVAAGHKFDPAQGELTAEDVEQMTGAFRKANEVFGISLPLPAGVENLKDPALVRELTEMLNVCGFVWQSFDLEWMRHAANLRKLQFSVICRGGAEDGATPLASWTDSLGAVLEQKGLAGALANCVMAMILAGTEELSAHYVRQAAQIAMARPFGPGLRGMLAMAAIDTSHHLGIDLTPFLRELAEPGADGKSVIGQLFDDVNPEDVRMCALRYLNAAGNSPDEALGEAIVQIVNAACDRLPPGSDKDQVVALMELKALEKKAALGASIDPLAVLASWSGRRDLAEYSRLLFVMVKDGYYDAGIRAESLRVLQRDASQDTYNGYILLALAVLRREGEGGDWQTPWRYLKAAIPTWEGSLLAETTIEIYQKLRARDRRNRVAYEKKVIFWQARKIERDHLKRLPALAREGKFFLIFLEYFVSMAEWGLRTDPPPDVFWNRYHTTPDQRADQIDSWRQSGGVVPAAVLRPEGGAVLSGDFLCLGHFLFSPPLELDQRFNADRQSFDVAAHGGFPALVAMIINLPEFPGSIREQLVRHSERLTRFSAPPELSAAAGE